MKTEGLRGYLYEYVFYASIEKAKATTGRPIMVSEARRLRAELEQELSGASSGVQDPNLKVGLLTSSIDKVMSANIEGYQPTTMADYSGGPNVKGHYAQFMDFIGRTRKQNGVDVRPQLDGLGQRLPISPYDPRFDNRSTTKKSGSELLFVPETLVDEFAGEEPARVARTRHSEMKLFRADDVRGKLVEAGPIYTAEDLSGMSALMGYMSNQEYESVKSWVIAGGRDASNNWDPNKFMSREALMRSTAILEELHQQGTPYTIVQDRMPGQIKAQITGTRIEVRLTDVSANEQYVGRVYDDGAMMYLTTNARGKNNKPLNYNPTPADCVKLLRLAQGRPVERTDGKGLVGQVRTHQYRTQAGIQERNDSYLSNGAQMSVLGPIPGQSNGMVVVRRDGSKRSSASEYFGDTMAATGAEKAEGFIRGAVESARMNLAAELDVEAFVSAYEEHRDEIAEGTWSPEFHGDQSIASIQRSYWDVLTGRRDNLLRPGQTEEEYNSRVGMIGELDMDGDARRAAVDMVLRGISYTGAPAEQVREHAGDVVDALVGSYDLRDVEVLEGDQVVTRQQRFDPVGVARFMTSEHGSWRNNVDIVAAMRAIDMEPDELMGSTFQHDTVRDRLIRFDEQTAVDVDQLEDPFLSRMGSVARSAIERNACQVESIKMDASGIIRYEATRMKTLRAEGENSTVRITGEIGQIFGQGEHGEIVTKFNCSENYLFVPGYEAVVVGQKAGENKSVEERTRLRGYEQLMAEKIEYQISSDLLSSRTEVGEPSNLNGVYRGLYDVRHEVDFLERSREEGLSDEWRSAILATEGSRIRYSNEIKDQSTINAEFQARSGRGRRDESNDNSFDGWVLTGGRNMAIMTSEGDGYFDPVMTSGSTNQGITRYLVESAVVNADGTITPGDKDDRAPLMKHPDTELMGYDPFDRQQMTASNLMQAAAVTAPTGTAMMTFGGWNFDDGMVVSKDFAQRYRIRGAEGQMRDLVVGDKLSDMHGNKGVISLVVDPEMDEDEAREQGLAIPVGVFRSNPDLGVVMSPFSAVSRFNGGSARELMQNASNLFVGEDYEEESFTVPGGIGEVRFIVTHMAVDAKTRVYDEEDLAAGRGRKASSQLAWALDSMGCEKVLAECYGENSAAAANLREMLVATGLDMGADGTLRIGWAPHNETDQRRLIEMPELRLNDAGKLHFRGGMASDFGAMIGDKGGDLEMPFPLKFLAGQELEQVEGRDTWKMPVMSSHLRSGQELDDGTSTSHDYTNYYMTIFEQACLYRHATELNESGRGDEKSREVAAKAQGKAQMAFDAIANDLSRRRFSGKHNVFREQMMASRMPNSATAVWSADPRLDIDQMAMGPAMAESLGVQADDHVLVWRDPMLRDAGVRYLRVAIDDRLTGVSINPVMDKSFDGDFDGDSVAVVKLNSRSAHIEALQKLSVEANLLDKGQQVELEVGDDRYDAYPLLMHDALDVKVSQHTDPGLRSVFADITAAANEVDADLSDGDLTPEEAWEKQHELVGQLSDYYHEALSQQYGGAALRFDSVQSHIDSVKHSCLDTGAKGSEAKLRDYGRYLGVEIDEDWNVRDNGDTFATRTDSEEVQYATAVKSHGTGVAGTFSQRGIKALRNVAPKAVLELTYPVTQSILQSKHDPEEARVKYELLMGPVRDLWKGRQLVEVRNSDGRRHWETARDKKGNEMQASTEDWQRQFGEVYGKDGLNVSVNPEHVKEVAEALSFEGEMLDMESEGFRGASTMDALAYGGDFAKLVDAARRHENLFDGENNRHFAPYTIRNNQRAMEIQAMGPLATEAELAHAEVKVVGRRDVQSSNMGRAASRRSSLAPTAGKTTLAAALAALETYEDAPAEAGSGYEL